MRPAILFLLVALALPACTTVAPRPVPPPAGAVAYDGAEQTAGILGALPNGAGFAVTARLSARYAALCGLYGGGFVPAALPGQGVQARPDGTFTITPEAMARYVTMNQWYRMGRTPNPPVKP